MPVDLFQSVPFHLKLHPRAFFEDLRVALPEHLGTITPWYGLTLGLPRSRQFNRCCSVTASLPSVTTQWLSNANWRVGYQVEDPVPPGFRFGGSSYFTNS
jgi:hypothetical protein